MLKLFSIFIIPCLLLADKWLETNIADKISIEFPGKATIDKTFHNYTSYLSSNKNCDFSVDIDEIPEELSPKNDEEALLLLNNSVEFSKRKGRFISSGNFNYKNIKGIEIKQYFEVKNWGKLIEIQRHFYFNNERYSLRCLYRNKDEAACEKNCEYFFSSFKNSNK